MPLKTLAAASASLGLVGADAYNKTEISYFTVPTTDERERELVFDAAQCGNESVKGPVLLLHGFPYSKDMWYPLMTELCEAGWHAVAYDQRGYSPDASPPYEDDYHYDYLRNDVFRVADKVRFEKFNLVTHDHGSCLGYHVVDDARGKERVLSYTALSIPHLNAFNDALVGDNIDEGQEVASQYFQLFVEPNSAMTGDNWVFRNFNPAGGGHFKNEIDFQKAVWWYNGALAAGVLPLPRLMTPDEIREQVGTESIVYRMRQVFSSTPVRPAVPNTRRLGKVMMPFLYGIGRNDTFIQGANPWGLSTRDWAGSTYTEMVVDGGHDLVDPSRSPEYSVMVEAIIEHMQPLAGGRQPPAPPESPPLLEDPVFWSVSVVAVGFVGIQAFVMLTGNTDDDEEMSEVLDPNSKSFTTTA